MNFELNIDHLVAQAAREACPNDGSLIRSVERFLRIVRPTMLNQQLPGLAESLGMPELAAEGFAFTWEGLAVARTLREGLMAGGLQQAVAAAAP